MLDSIRSLAVRAASQCLLALPFLIATSVNAGPYIDAGHSAGTMTGWATAVDDLVRGPVDIAAPAGPLASHGLPADVLGAATGGPADILSLGDGGSITVFLADGISNGPGDDFAVFENGFIDFNGLFAELAYVEVASNGVDFAEFESHTVNNLSLSGFDYLDPTDYDGFAGRHEALFGTGFDLASLAFDPLVQSGALDVTDVRYVRITDVIGDGSTTDSFGNALYDPYSTPFATGGFDLDAVGIIHVPEPSFYAGLFYGLLLLAASFGHLTTATGQSTRRGYAVAGLMAFAVASPAAALVATFDDLGLGAESYENGSGLSGSYVSGGATFDNNYFPSFDGFSGFAASTLTNNTTPGFGNQFANITGGDAGGAGGYGVFFETFGSPGRITLPSVQTVTGAYITNTTYAALSMLSGDAFAKQFGGVTGTDPDYFRLLIEGFDDFNASTGVVEFMLADYRNLGGTLDYIVDQWTWLDLTGLGDVSSLGFSFDSSDVGSFGINTPQYFAIDNLTTIPEPSTALMLGLGLTGLARLRRRA